MKSKTVLIWVAVISVIAIGGFVAYAYVNKQNTTTKKISISSKDLSNIGSFLGGLFKKKEATPATNTWEDIPGSTSPNFSAPLDYNDSSDFS